MYQAPRGTSDILPEEEHYWQYIEQTAVKTCHRYGYRRIETPVFEDAGLFVRTVGPDSDIVQKEMYTFADRGGNQMTLRPEGTAPVCRAYLEHGLGNLPQPVRLYYLAAIFRYERPQAGRYRQHHQFGCEAIGDGDPAVDAEVIDMAWQFFRDLGLAGLTLHLNSIGCRQCRPEYLKVLREYHAGRASRLCPDCQARMQRNPLRLLDCKNPSCQELSAGAPRSSDHLCPACAEHFRQLQKYLDLLGLPSVLDFRLVRGLDYYTRTVFEFQPAEEGAQSTVGGGGRYDDLIEELGGKSTPAIGFAAGIERIVLNLKRQGTAVPPVPQPQVFIAYVGEDARHEAMKLGATLRQAGTGVIQAGGGRSLKAQLRQADAAAARKVLIIGEQEMKTGTVILRDMATAEQKTVPVSQLAGLL